MLIELGKRARTAARQLSRSTAEEKRAALMYMADSLTKATGTILKANQKDVNEGVEAEMSPALVDRLTLTEERLAGIISDLERVADLPDPVGEIFDAQVLDNGLQVRKQRVPIGVLGVIYEARPNVTVDVAGLALKTGNSVILRGGSETIRTNRALVEVIRKALAACELPIDAVQFIDNPDRALVREMLDMYEYIDMLIPRGGAGLHKFCRENSRIPVITGGIGICHLFVDKSADLAASLDVIQNAKVQRPTVCNALDTVLVHQEIADELLPALVNRLVADGVTFRADQSALSYLDREAFNGDGSQDAIQRESPQGVSSQNPNFNLPTSVSPAGPDDFDTEWLSLVLGLKVVPGIEEAIAHIVNHSTGHSDGILTKNDVNASRFVAQVDSAAVYVNASTRFTDGGQLGMGAEVAISTQRLHARGPMALKELTTYKWVIVGDNHVRK
jgi:glutamate-5-semialdehyde dehydrogenase